MSYSLVCSAAGADLGSCLQNISGYLEQEGSVFRVLNLGSYIGMDYRQLMAQTRPQVRDLIQKAFVNALSDLNDSPAHSILGCHLTLYDSRSQVFINAVHASQVCLEGVKPDRVIVLIDDIYDMLSRLTTDSDARPGMYDLDDLATKVLGWLSPGSGDQPPPAEPSSKDLSLAALDSQVNELRFLLSWRRSEMLAAESLADELGVPLYLLGVKHPLEVFRIALEGTAPSATYISHPISRHRRDLAESGKWSQDVESLNRLPLEMARRGILTIMPTAIDELRFSRPLPDDIFMRTSGTSPRWPAMASDYGLISPVYDPGQVEHVGIPGEVDAFEVDPGTASTYVRTVEAAVYSEIPYRDHYLVNHCPNLIVFRPREGGNKFSSGVIAEIALFDRLAKDGGRKMVVIHDSRDIDLIIERISRDNGLMNLDAPLKMAVDHIRKLAPERLYKELRADQISRFARVGYLDDSHLDRTSISRTAQRMFYDECWREAAIATLYSELSGLESLTPWCHVLVGDTTRTRVLEGAAKLLSKESAPQGSNHSFEQSLMVSWGEEYEERLLGLTERLREVAVGVPNPD